MSAYACCPGAGSEPGAGWEWALAAAENHEVLVLTRSNNRPLIEAWIESHGEAKGRLRFDYLDGSRLALWLKARTSLVQVYYIYWQYLAWRRATVLNRAFKCDVSHHVTFASDWLPAGIAFLPAPFVWGPIGGSTGIAPWMVRWLGVRGLLREVSREAITRGFRGVFGTIVARRATIILAQNRDVAQHFRRFRVRVEPNVALRSVDAAGSKFQGGAQGGDQLGEQQTLTAAFVGRLVPLKGLVLAVRAIHLAPDWRLVVIGEGPERRRAQRLVRELGVERRVQFRGTLPRSEVIRLLRECDALLAPSLHESGGWAVGEATSVGTPVVCVDRGGPPLIAGSAGRCVSGGRHIAEALAAALGDIENLETKAMDRWSHRRLGAVLNGVYREAVDYS